MVSRKRKITIKVTREKQGQIDIRWGGNVRGVYVKKARVKKREKGRERERVT